MPAYSDHCQPIRPGGSWDLPWCSSVVKGDNVCGYFGKMVKGVRRPWRIIVIQRSVLICSLSPTPHNQRAVPLRGLSMSPAAALPHLSVGRCVLLAWTTSLGLPGSREGPVPTPQRWAHFGTANIVFLWTELVWKIAGRRLRLGPFPWPGRLMLRCLGWIGQSRQPCLAVPILPYHPNSWALVGNTEPLGFALEQGEVKGRCCLFS